MRFYAKVEHLLGVIKSSKLVSFALVNLFSADWLCQVVCIHVLLQMNLQVYVFLPVNEGPSQSKLLYLQKFHSMWHFKQELVNCLNYYNSHRLMLKPKGLPPAIHRQLALLFA